MNKQLPVFNWSLQKLLATETGAFNKAKLQILYTVLMFSLLKAFIVIGVAAWYGQHFQLTRGLLALGVYAVLLKLILINKKSIHVLTHIMIWMGVLIVWSNILISVQTINIITLQFIFMIILSSFYLLNTRVGLMYAAISVAPVIIDLIWFSGVTKPLGLAPETLAAPGTMVIIVLNFVTIIVSHYLYHKAFSATLAEKESLNTQLKAAVEEANTLAQSKSDFLSTMSHELRTPLNAVIGMTDLLMEDARDEEQKENLKTLSFSALNLHTLINDILDFSKLESGKLQLEEISVNLGELMRNICAGLRLQANEKGLELALNIDDELINQHVFTDPTRISQIIYNLAGNGLKFTHKGKVTISMKHLEQNARQVKIRFSVADTGIGIPADKHESVFEAFVQASTNTTRNFGGTGLGLSIVKRLLLLLGSDIHLKSSPGKGSDFFFDIVFKPDPNPVTGKNAENGTGYDLSGLRVLIAEDNPMNVFVIRKHCLKWNINPDIAENGKQVIEHMNSKHYDVVLMDIHMPEMDGYEATRLIRKMDHEEKAKTPVIALTASVSHDISSKIKEAGMNGYVRKPFNPKELYGRLKNLIPLAEKV